MLVREFVQTTIHTPQGMLCENFECKLFTLHNRRTLRCDRPCVRASRGAFGSHRYITTRTPSATLVRYSQRLCSSTYTLCWTLFKLNVGTLILTGEPGSHDRQGAGRSSRCSLTNDYSNIPDSLCRTHN